MNTAHPVWMFEIYCPNCSAPIEYIVDGTLHLRNDPYKLTFCPNCEAKIIVSLKVEVEEVQHDS